MNKLLFCNLSRRGTVGLFARKLTHSAMAGVDLSLHVVRADTPVLKLECAKSFNGLSNTNKLYAHYLAKASFDGTLVTFCQRSPESPAILYIFTKVFRTESIDVLKKKATDLGWTEDDWKSLLVYYATFYYNAGNYYGFGDRKIIPANPQNRLREFLFKTKAFNEDEKLVSLYNEVETSIYSLSDKEQILGFPDSGTTAFHSKNITKEDAEFAAKFFKSLNFEGWNTRLEKKTDGDKIRYVVKIASVNKDVSKVSKHEFEGREFDFIYGDYSPLLKRVVSNLELAKGFVANKNQQQAVEHYIEHFNNGSVDEHKDASRSWIKDVNPIVESYIGFIENYSDPDGVRSDFEGFVAVVDKDTSAKFQKLVDNASEFLTRLPWEKEYEKDKFLKPDFTSLNVLGFGSNGIPAGINIPNYDEIRQNEGFKNVSLGNVISAIPQTKTEFLGDEDDELYRKYHCASFEVQVGLHELLGHGSGKLFYTNRDGSTNFEKDLTKDLEGNPIKSWYEEGETWSSKFGSTGSAYEECRAEAVGYYLCCYDDIMAVFGFEGQDAETVRYVNWLNEIRAGLVSLEFFDSTKKKWGQAHCNARYVLFRVALEAGQGFVTVDETTDDKGKPNLHFKLDRSKIQAVGKPAIANFLKQLQYYKSTGNEKEGIEFFHKWSTVSEQHLKWRDVVLARRKPRRVFVQHNTEVKTGNEVTLLEYDSTPEGVIQSILDRHSPESLTDLLTVYREQKETIFV